MDSKYLREIFVFGSNSEGRHSKGAAREALVAHGAIYGRARGIQGNSYAIVTKELRRNYPPVDFLEVKYQVEDFLKFARKNPRLKFNVTPIGCGLAGFTPEEIAPLFKEAPSNIELPLEFRAILNVR